MKYPLAGIQSPTRLIVCTPQFLSSSMTHGHREIRDSFQMQSTKWWTTWGRLRSGYWPRVCLRHPVMALKDRISDSCRDTKEVVSFRPESSIEENVMSQYGVEFH